MIRCRGGYACLHPWPELGDGTLGEEMRALAGGKDTPVTRNLRRCLALDGLARAEGRSLFEGHHAPPESHATLIDPSPSAVDRAASQGFAIAKLKANPANLTQIAGTLESAPLPVRLDFNESMEPIALNRWLDELSEEARSRIDFLEDPCPYDPDTWSRLASDTGVRLALDRQASRADGGFDVLVIKPAVAPMDRLVHLLKEKGFAYLVTSYMDHPLGQLFAAHEAVMLARQFPQQTLLAGLATHLLWEDPPAAFPLGSGPHLRLPQGTGLGFDDALASLPWKPLSN